MCVTCLSPAQGVFSWGGGERSEGWGLAPGVRAAAHPAGSAKASAQHPQVPTELPAPFKSHDAPGCFLFLPAHISSWMGRLGR